MMLGHICVISANQRLFDSTSSEVMTIGRLAKATSSVSVLVLCRFVPVNLPVIAANVQIVPVSATGHINRFLHLRQAAIQLFKKQPYQLILAEDPRLIAYVGVKISRQFQIPLSIEVDTSIQTAVGAYPSWQRPIVLQLIKGNLAAARSIRVPSETARKSLINDLTIQLSNYQTIFIAPKSYDLAPFYKPAHYRPTNIRCIGINSSVHEEDCLLLIDAFTQLIKYCPTAKLTIIGDGPGKNQLASRVINSGLNNHIFLVGHKGPAERAALLHQHDIFIGSSQVSGWSEAYVEAFAAGLPVITPSTKVWDGLLQPNTTCLIAQDNLSLASCILYLMRHPEEAYRLGKNGQMYLRQHFETDILIQPWLNGLYHTVSQP